METLLLYLLLGSFVGVLAGLFGVGGGLVIVPVLVFVFNSQGVAEAVIVHLAIGTSLATIVVTALSSMREHHRHGAVDFQAFARLTPGIVLGALLGALVTDFLPGASLRIVFGVFELLVAVQIGLGIKAAAHRQLPGWAGMTAMGSVIGAVSAIVGIGGGVLTVPFLVWCNATMQKAVATSAACGLPIALAGAAGFIWAGWDELALPAWSSGYVYWPAALGITLASVATAPLGAKLAHRLPAAKLRRYFALFLAALGIRMLLS